MLQARTSKLPPLRHSYLTLSVFGVVFGQSKTQHRPPNHHFWLAVPRGRSSRVIAGINGREVDTRYTSYDLLLFFYMNVLLPDLSMVMTEDEYIPSMGRYLPISILFNEGIVNV